MDYFDEYLYDIEEDEDIGMGPTLEELGIDFERTVKEVFCHAKRKEAIPCPKCPTLTQN